MGHLHPRAIQVAGAACRKTGVVSPSASWADRSFRVMGTTARLLASGGAPEAMDRAEDTLHGLEARWSRFLPESELSLLNAAGGGRPVVVSAGTFALIARAVDAWRRTGGTFDPTGLDAIRAWGYDRD